VTRIVVNVTQEDILRGRPRDRFGCPIAKALLRRKDVAWAAVGFSFVQVTFLDREPMMLELPDRAQDFIGEFDLTRRVTPIRFSLEIPEPEPEAE
jgi:hypothetical protein